MPKKLSFKGGVHPKDKKEYTSTVPIVELEVPNELIFPVSQHIGAPCTPCVAVGDHVNVGTKIADSEAFVSAPVHSSVSGTVKAIEPRPVPNGTMTLSIVIENDFNDTLDESVKPIDYKSVKPDDIPSLVREAGVVGMGGATFPTHVKLMPPADKKIDTVIVNGAECEPYLTSDHRVMLETPDEVILGLKIMLYRFGITNGHIAVEENKPDAIAVLKEKCEGQGIIVDTLKKKYPQGGEKQLIYAVTKRVVELGKLPADVGVVVVNVDTCTAIARKFLYGTPLMRRIVTVVGTPVKNPANYKVRIGTPIEYILRQNGEFAQEPAKIIIGGPMMGVAQFRLDVPVIKGTSAVLCLTKEEARIPEEGPCIRCGKCVSHCPMKLMPLYLRDYARKEDWESCEKMNVTACIECGCCSFECPSKRHLVQNIRVAKQEVIALQRSRQK
ncbi:MAG: electron transport complex subunit RsxC [Clostridia bacterium]|nr:electron transport complex subunit RsxC [Clostridia bacterium]